ncbi:hypothetical protein ANCCAN_21738 [Ancylostoma caninum]|uniref:Uncharacterized protein n=1 Tax=Ancylostoma caninum TaxID=29170 RepID=A0A368FQH0_ANCCA|nr:hypothetical protein ANCCAN_21738 [Ancylostoma caninum]
MPSTMSSADEDSLGKRLCVPPVYHQRTLRLKLRKSKCLERPADILGQTGFARRTNAQLDQRIRDMLRRSKQYAAQIKMTNCGLEEAHRRNSMFLHTCKLYQGCIDKPRVHGLQKPMEICGT